MTGPLWVRCGLDLEHEQHEHDGGMCDGGISAPPATGPTRFIDLFPGTSPLPHPWHWSSLTTDQATELVEQLEVFAAHYNATYVVDERLILLGCWPLHPGLAAELASLYAQYVTAHQGAMATAETSLYWHDRWLVGFQQRLPNWYGGNTGCRPGDHKPNWNPALARLAEAAPRPTGFDLDDVVAALRTNPAHLEV